MIASFDPLGSNEKSITGSGQEKGQPLYVCTIHATLKRSNYCIPFTSMESTGISFSLA